MGVWYKDIDFQTLDFLVYPDHDDELLINDVSDKEKKIRVEDFILNSFPSFVLANDGSLALTNDGGFVFAR
jgi:hypothetical protein